MASLGLNLQPKSLSQLAPKQTSLSLLLMDRDAHHPLPVQVTTPTPFPLLHLSKVSSASRPDSQKLPLGNLPCSILQKEELGSWWACKTCLGSHSWETASTSLLLPGPPRMASLGHCQVFSAEAVAGPLFCSA